MMRPEESGCWINPDRCFVVELNGKNEEEVGEKMWLEEPGLADAPLPSAFLDKNASGLDRKQEARADREVLGESAWLAGGYWPEVSYGGDLLDGYTSLRRQRGAISLSNSTLQTVWRRARWTDLWAGWGKRGLDRACCCEG